MVLLNNNANGGTDGVAVSTVNSGGVSGNAWNSIGGTAPVYENTSPIKGPMSILCDDVGGVQRSLHWTFTSTTQAVARFYIRPETTNSQQGRILSFNAGGRLYYNNGRILAIYSASGAALWTAGAALSLGTVYRIEASNLAATSTTGVFVLNTYVGDSTTPEAALSTTISSANFGTALTSVSVGRLIPFNGGSITIDNIAVETGTLTMLGPTLTIAQEGFRWRNDDGDEDGATWLAAQDTNAEIDLDTNARLRVLLDTTEPETVTPTLYYKKSTDSTWLQVPVGSGGGSPIYIAPSDNITAGGEATTAQLTAPEGKTTADFAVGRMWDDENGMDEVVIG